MKIDKSKVKICTSEVPIDVAYLIKRMREGFFVEVLREIKTWTYGKCELYHWIEVLNLADDVLDMACLYEHIQLKNPFIIKCDRYDYFHTSQLRETILLILNFTTLLIEHSFSRHLYNSIEHLITLLSSSDMPVVLAVLNLLYMFSKRSANFIPRLNSRQREALLRNLRCLAESWGGRDDGFGLAECCKDSPIETFAPSATVVHFEYYITKKFEEPRLQVIHLELTDEHKKLDPGEIMEILLKNYEIPKDKRMQLFTKLRLAHYFPDYKKRLMCVQARLQALSVLVYSMGNYPELIYPGFLDELIQVLEMDAPHLVEIRCAALRALTSIIHIHRNPHVPKLHTIITVTGAASYHGFLPTLVRACIASLTTTHKVDEDSDLEEEPTFPLHLATALFSFLYHLASYETGAEALVSCGVMESLLQVIKWPGSEIEHITFVTRAVRVIDLITNNDMQAFQMYGGLAIFINRLEMEVNRCCWDSRYLGRRDSESSDSDESDDLANIPERGHMDVDANAPNPAISHDPGSAYRGRIYGLCLPQRSALLKSMLNFLKKAIGDPTFNNSIRHVMEGSLPSSLKHIISNADYYGPSLFLLATDVVTVYVFEEPALLSALQDNGLTNAMLRALLVKQVPATREVLGSLPNVFSALCLNARGLEAFIRCSPFEKLFKVLLSPLYLTAMRRRRSSDQVGDTATNLGTAIAELMRHQPKLKKYAMAAVIKLLDQLCNFGRDPRYVFWKGLYKAEAAVLRSSQEAVNSDDEFDEEDAQAHNEANLEEESDVEEESTERIPIPLADYICNVLTFVDAIVSNNSTSDHCKEFVAQGGLRPLISILNSPNFPVDISWASAVIPVATVCKTILTLSKDPKVLAEIFTQANHLLDEVHSLITPTHTFVTPNTIQLLKEVANTPNPEEACAIPNQTPLLHAIAALQNYTAVLHQICMSGQPEVRCIYLCSWGSKLGLQVLEKYVSILPYIQSETNALHCVKENDEVDPRSDFALEDLERLRFRNAYYEAQSPRGNKTKTWRILYPEESGLNRDYDDPEPSPNSIPILYIPYEEVVRPAVCHTQKKLVQFIHDTGVRLQNAISRLIQVLLPMCAGSPSPLRHRRNQTGTLDEVAAWSAYEIVKTIGKIFDNNLSMDKLPITGTPLLTVMDVLFVLQSVMYWMIEEKGHPYHLMLNEFVLRGGHLSLYQTLARIVGCLDPQEGDQYDEGLQWGPLIHSLLERILDVMDKLLNSKFVLESPNSIPSKANSSLDHPFDATRFMMTMQKVAFDIVKLLIWKRTPRFIQRHFPFTQGYCLGLWCSVLEIDRVIEERLQKSKESTAHPETSEGNQNLTSGASTSAANQADVQDLEPEISVEALNRLIDMGFSRALSIQALRNTTSVEQATEYVLSAPLQNQEMDVSEEDQVHQAIAMSLGEPSAKNGSNNAAQQRADEQAARAKALEAARRNTEVNWSRKEELDKFTMKAPALCLHLLDIAPRRPPVFSVSELLCLVAKRHGDDFRDKMLRLILNEMWEFIQTMIDDAYRATSTAERTDIFMYSEEARNTEVRVHLFALLFEEMRVPGARAVMELEIVDKLMYLFFCAESSISTTHTPKWLAPMLLLLDLYERVAIIFYRKELMNKLSTPHWKWFDLATGKWCPYSADHNKVINQGYWNGDRSVHISFGRRKYTLHFATMNQCNDETGNRRPIMMEFCDEVREFQKRYAPARAAAAQKGEEIPEVIGDDTYYSERAEEPMPRSSSTLFLKGYINVIGEAHCYALVRSSIRMLKMPVEKDALNALLRLVLCITRRYEYAIEFARRGGVQLLVNFSHHQSFPEFINLATMIIRHVIEEPRVLRMAMERVLKAKTHPDFPPAHKELFYMLRTCGSAVCRHRNTFTTLAKEILRIDCNLSDVPKLPDDEKDNRIFLKTIPTTHPPSRPDDTKLTRTVIEDLLNTLAFIPKVHEEVKEDGEDGTACQVPSPITQANKPQLQAYVPEDPPGFRVSPVKTTRAGFGVFHFQRSSILKLLAEAVRSYAHVCREIIQFTYPPDISDLIAEGGSALYFILNHLVDPAGCDIQDHKEITKNANMLIAALASCNHSPDTQAVLVTEVRNLLLSTLAMPECKEKHDKISQVCYLIGIMIDNCPSVVPHVPMNGPKAGNSIMPSNIVRLMLRKGLIMDLARIPHSLNLSSQSLHTTINSLLKPLETLSRLVNHPNSPSPSAKVIKPKDKGPTTQEAGAQTAGSNSTSAQTGPVGDNSGHSAGGSNAATIQLRRSITSHLSVGFADSVPRPLAASLGENQQNSESNAAENFENWSGGDDEEDGDPEAADVDIVGSDGGSQQPRHIRETSSEATTPEEEDEELEDEEEDELEDDEDESEVEEDDDDDDVDEEEDEGDDSPPGSGYDDIFESEDGLFRVPGLDHENPDDILMIQYTEPDTAMPLVLGDNNRALQLPYGLEEVAEVPNDNTGGSSSTPQHPLMNVPSNAENAGNVPPTRAQRANRQRRYHYLQLNSRNTDPPMILQRLLGPGVHDLPLSASQALANNFRDTRVVVMENGLGLFNNEEDSENNEQNGYLHGPSLSATLKNVPTALQWWNEESKLLDGDSMAACVIGVCAELIGGLEDYRDAEQQGESKKGTTAEAKIKSGDSKAATESKMDVHCDESATTDDDSQLETTVQMIASEASTIVNSVLRSRNASSHFGTTENNSFTRNRSSTNNSTSSARTMQQQNGTPSGADLNTMDEQISLFYDSDASTVPAPMETLSNPTSPASSPTPLDNENQDTQALSYEGSVSRGSAHSPDFHTPCAVEMPNTENTVNQANCRDPVVSFDWSASRGSVNSPEFVHMRREFVQNASGSSAGPIWNDDNFSDSSGSPVFGGRASTTPTPNEVTPMNENENANDDGENVGDNESGEAISVQSCDDTISIASDDSDCVPTSPRDNDHENNDGNLDDEEEEVEEEQEEEENENDQNSVHSCGTISVRSDSSSDIIVLAHHQNTDDRGSVRSFGTTISIHSNSSSEFPPVSAADLANQQNADDQGSFGAISVPSDASSELPPSTRHQENSNNINVDNGESVHSFGIISMQNNSSEHPPSRRRRRNANNRGSVHSFGAISIESGTSSQLPPNPARGRGRVNQSRRTANNRTSGRSRGNARLQNMNTVGPVTRRNSQNPGAENAANAEDCGSGVSFTPPAEFRTPVSSPKPNINSDATTNPGDSASGVSYSPPAEFRTPVSSPNSRNSDLVLDDSCSSISDPLSPVSSPNAGNSQDAFPKNEHGAAQTSPMEIPSNTTSPESTPTATTTMDENPASSAETPHEPYSSFMDVINTSNLPNAAEAEPSSSTTNSVPMDMSRTYFTSSSAEAPARNMFEELDIDAADVWLCTQLNEQPANVPATCPEEADAEASTSAEVETVTPAASTAASEEVTAAPSPAPEAPAATESTVNPELPEGVDPSFLAALPEEMRQEVIAEQLRLQRIQQRARSNVNTGESESSGVLEVNPEFLAALPPNIQEEVLTQQRLEQQRQAAAAANPNDPVDAAAFFQNLPPTLRQAILTDMEESQIAVLPPELAAEAHNLRRDWEAHNRQQIQERIFGHVGPNSSALSSILRNPGRAAGRYAIHSVPQRTWGHWGRPPRGQELYTEDIKYKGRLVLDQETLACLLVLLFIDNSNIDLKGLQRVLTNLCFHAPTRQWVTKALVAILEKCSECQSLNVHNFEAYDGIQTVIQRTEAAPYGFPVYECFQDIPQETPDPPAWLNITREASLGSRTNIFYVPYYNSNKKKDKSNRPSIVIHPQSIPAIAQRVLDTFITLTHQFNLFYIPLRNKSKKEKENPAASSSAAGPSNSNVAGPSSNKSRFDSDIWEVLLRLNSTGGTYRKGKSIAQSPSNSSSDQMDPTVPNVSSCFQKIVSMLNYNMMKQNRLLTDRLLRLLFNMSTGLIETRTVETFVIPSEVTAAIAAHNASNDGTPAPTYTVPKVFVKLGKVAPKVANLRVLEIPEDLLKLVVDVMTSNQCSEDGVTCATSFLSNVSAVNDHTFGMILKVLSDGAKKLGSMVCQHIVKLMEEVKALNLPSPKEKEEGDINFQFDRNMKGKLQDRFTNSTVVISASTKPKANCELQLPAMEELSSKNSPQLLLLKSLKVILRLRNAHWSTYERDKANAKARAAASLPVTTQPPGEGSGMMEGHDATEPTAGTSKEGARQNLYTDYAAGFPILSEQLGLDTLWETLSECLSMLQHTPDHYAVLVLQPTVEAFFLVHSESISCQKLKRPRRADAPTESITIPATEAAPAAATAESNNQQEPSPAENEASSSSSTTSDAQPGTEEVSQHLQAVSLEATPAALSPSLSPDAIKFLKFAELHRTVLNQILRQSTVHLADGPFSVLVDHTRMLDFDVKQKYFRTELERMDVSLRHDGREELQIMVARNTVFQDSFNKLHRRTPDEWKNRLYIVFEGEEGQDAGGLLREWYMVISREIFNPDYALFAISPGDRVTYMINSMSHCNSHHLEYFKFVGRVIAKAIYDSKLLDCYFTRSFYKHILGIQVKYTDMESEDYSFYKGLVYLMEHDISDLGYDLTFSTEVQEFGVTEVRDLIPNGRSIPVTEKNKMDYVRLVCQMKMTGAIRKQLDAFLEGFYDIIPKRLISIFNEQELELLISGLPNVDIEDLKANTEYHKYQSNSLQIQWFWRALRSLDQEDRAKFLQFVTGTSKVPLQGFCALEGMNGVQKFQIHRDDRSTDRLPSAHTCFNQLDLPVYETFDKLCSYLIKAIHECSEGFGFA